VSLGCIFSFPLLRTIIADIARENSGIDSRVLIFLFGLVTVAFLFLMAMACRVIVIPEGWAKMCALFLVLGDASYWGFSMGRGVKFG
jgi:hypothetical protein